MKTTTSKPLLQAVVIVFALVVIAAIAALREHAAMDESTAQYESLSKDAKEYGMLKTRWSIQESQSVFDYLRNHPNRVKEEKRGGNIYLEFNNLSADEFNRLSNKILNSMLVIKKLTLQRNEASKGVIIVELES